MSLSVHITREELNLAVLELTAAPYGIDADEGISVGSFTWNRTVATSPLVEGEVDVHLVKGRGLGFVAVEVEANTAALLRTRVDAVVAAFSQWSYVLQVVDGTESWSWRCSAANYRAPAINGWWDAEVRLLTALFQFPHDPTPIPPS
jgi:hypothetical protein